MISSQAIQAYKASQQLNQNPRDVLTAVHDELYRAIVSAKSAYEQNMLDQMCANVARAVRILTVLVTTLNFSVAGGDGARLKKYYQRLLSLVNSCRSGNNKSSDYQDAINLLRPLCQQFRNVDQDQIAPISQNIG